ncbi:AMP-binding protein [Neobacillus niacini]|uniref:class I adenylate-forming enzyme family protein n=1 Tax=Neobacillus niacini TaxID=86668 RepID=UPI002FFF5C23
MRVNIGNWVTKAAIKTPYKLAIINKNSTFSYQWIENMSNYFANDLVNKYNVKPGDRIALMFPNNIHFIVAYYAVLKVGATCVPIHHLLKNKEVKYILKHSESRLLISEKTILNVKPNVGDFPYLEHVIVSVSLCEDNLFEPFMMFKISNQSNISKLHVSKSEEDVAIIFYTSGTSGTPKGVMLTHENIFSKMNPLKQAIKFSSEDKMLSGLPMVHVYGQIMAMNFVVWCNATLILLEDENESCIVWGLENQGATVMMSTPTVYYRLNCYLKNNNKSINHNLRFAITGGSPSSSQLKREYEQYFKVQLLDSYGLTETSATIIMEHPDGYHRKPGSIGRSLSNHDVQILDESGIELPPGQVGEIAVRSKTVMKRYFKDDILQAQSSKNGWFLTGDIGYQDIGGNFFLIDRRKDIIQTMGFVVSPSEIEEVLLEHSKIQETAVVGIPDEEKGEVIKAYIVVRLGQNLSEQEVFVYLKEHLANFKCPSLIEFVDNLPRNNSGKLLKRLLK